MAATDPQVRYVGRFDCTDAAGPRCAWSASTVAVTISGGSQSVKLKESGNYFWQVVVNGEPPSVLELQAGEHVYPVVADLPAGRHTIELVKRTEAAVGDTQVLGFQIDDNAKLLPTPERTRRIEVMGTPSAAATATKFRARRSVLRPRPRMPGWPTVRSRRAR